MPKDIMREVILDSIHYNRVERVFVSSISISLAALKKHGLENYVQLVDQDVCDAWGVDKEGDEWRLLLVREGYCGDFFGNRY